jgi:hypothetical protein
VCVCAFKSREFLYQHTSSCVLMASTTIDSTVAKAPNAASSTSDRNYVIMRFKNELDENALTVDARGSAKDLLKVKYKDGEKNKTLYLQSASCTLRSPLTIDGTMQHWCDFDLWETSSKQSREFVRKIEAIERKVVEFLARTVDRDSETESSKRLLKSSLRTLQKAKKASMPAFRLSTEDFQDEGLFGSEGKDATNLEDVRVQFIAELAGVKVAKRNGLAQCLWKLSQLRVLPDVPQKEVTEGDRIEKGVNVFEAEEDEDEAV